MNYATNSILIIENMSNVIFLNLLEIKKISRITDLFFLYVLFNRKSHKSFSK